MSLRKSDIIKMNQTQKQTTCDVCMKTFPNVSHLVIHMRIHTGERPYTCKFCKKAFTQKGHLNVHEKRHLGPGDFKCKSCMKRFHQKIHLKQHMVRHHQTNSTFVKQTSVSKSSSLTENNDKNNKTHLKSDMSHMSPTRPNNVLGTGKSMMYDKRTERRYICSCGTKFTQSWHLKRHVNSHMTKNSKLYMPGFNAKQVNYLPSIDFRKLSVHRAKKQKSQRQYHKCKYCDYECDYPYRLKRHMRAHTKSVNEKCTKVTAKAKSVPQGKIETECEHLSLKNSSKGFVNDVPYTLISEQTRKQKKCDVCTKTFRDVSHLAVHMRIHTGDRPYTCKFCKKAFTQKGHLNVHKKRHLGPGDFKCKSCMKRFYQKIHLKQHMVRHHQTNSTFVKQTSVSKSAPLTENNDKNIKTHLKSDMPLLPSTRPNNVLGTGQSMMYDKGTERRYICSCGTKFTQLYHLKRHVNSHMTKNSNLYMPGFNAKQVNYLPSIDFRKLSVHRAKKQTYQRQYHKCKYCDYECDYPYRLKRHMSTHTKSVNEKCTKVKGKEKHVLQGKIETEAAQSTSGGQKNNHINNTITEQRHHVDDSQLPEQLKINTNQNVELHNGAVKFNKHRPYRCTCGKEFKKRSHLKDHVECHTTQGSRLFIQGFNPDEVNYYPKHPARKSKRQRQFYKCQNCDYEVAYPYLLRRHMLSHRSVNAKAKYVPQGKTHSAFEDWRLETSKSNRKVTENGNDTDRVEHHPRDKRKIFGQRLKITKPKTSKVLKFLSYICLRKKKIVKKAIEIVNQPKFKCVVCDRKFTANINFTVHMRIHTGELPFKCEICKKSFVNESIRKVHMKIRHEERQQRTEVISDDVDDREGTIMNVEFNEDKESIENSKVVRSEEKVEIYEAKDVRDSNDQLDDIIIITDDENDD